MKKVIVGKSKGIADAEQCDIHVVVSSFLCKGCGSDNIKERSGYKVCFDCGKGH